MARLSTETWMEVRAVFETKHIGFAELGRMFGVSGAMVGRRCKADNWDRASSKSLASLADTSISKPCNGSSRGKRNLEKLQEIVNVYGKTGSIAITSGCVDIDPGTLDNWCKEEPELSRQMMIARHKQLAKHFDVIVDSKDWKAHKEILARSPETKEQWGDIQEKGPTIILNIHRDEVVIES